MADVSKSILSVVATNASQLQNISIKNGQLTFVKDKRLIALDLNGKRMFYNQIATLGTDEERRGILAPINGLFYFVISTAVLWTYNNQWIQITTPPNEVVFIGVELPELGSKNTLYVNTNDKDISVWNNETKKYEVVADKTEAITTEEILSLFN